MQRRSRTVWTVALVAAGALVLGAAAEASHLKENPKKHKIVYHFNGDDAGDHVKKAKAVLGNIMNHVKGVGGWDHIEALVLVTHGDGVTPFIEKGMDPEVRKRYEMLTTSGMKMGV
jgi:intracellular sulfur oxidation DsrE/DsrF family protein